ncbi:MAG: UDP-N-acetylmuramoyl-tripeptide--D-alanyl-D-alanine ligase [Candidatus Cryptobacteroides sp.]
MTRTDTLYEIFLECGGRVTTDSRNILGGELFFALKGENFDGNAYAEKALEAGAAYAVVDEDAQCLKHISQFSARLFPVEDTAVALRKLARFYRQQRRDIPFIGLTGTNGKTTTKELVNAVLSAKFRTAATKGNFNNNIGVPLTVLSIPFDAQIAIIEMGASHPGDIEELVGICEPDFGLVTNVGRAHLLGFGSFEGVKKTKGELYDFIAGKRKEMERGGVSLADGKIFLNQDNPDLVQMALSRGFEPGRSAVGYGLRFSGTEILPTDAEHPFLRLRLSDGSLVRTRLVGAYNADNVLSALCVGEYFGVERGDAIAAIEAYVPSNNRSQMQKTERNVLIVDAYNANPSSMDAALTNFAGFEAPVKIALLGDMLELGEASVEEHRRIVEKVGACGVRAYYVGTEFGKAGAQPCFASSDELAGYILAHPQDFTGAAILVKGSRGTRMERTVPVL